MSKAAAKKVGIFGEKFGKQSADESNVYAVYEAEQPYRIKDRNTGEIKLMKPSAFNKMKRLESIARLEKKKRREERKRQRQELLFTQMQETVNPKPKPVEKPKEKTKEDVLNEMADESKAAGDAAQEAADKENMFDDDSMLSGTTGSKKHAQFLREALAKIESEVDLSMPYVEAVEAQVKEKELRKSTKKKISKRASLNETAATNSAVNSRDANTDSPKKLADRKTIAATSSGKSIDSEVNAKDHVSIAAPAKLGDDSTPPICDDGDETDDKRQIENSDTKDRSPSRPKSMVSSRPSTSAQSKRADSTIDSGRKSPVRVTISRTGSPQKAEQRISTPVVAAPPPPIVSGGSTNPSSLFYQVDSDDEAEVLLKSWGVAATSPVSQVQLDHEDYILSSHENLHRSHEALREIMSSESSRATSSRLFNRIRTASRNSSRENLGTESETTQEFFNDNSSANNVKIAV